LRTEPRPMDSLRCRTSGAATLNDNLTGGSSTTHSNMSSWLEPSTNSSPTEEEGTETIGTTSYSPSSSVSSQLLATNTHGATRVEQEQKQDEDESGLSFHDGTNEVHHSELHETSRVNAASHFDFLINASASGPVILIAGPALMALSSTLFVMPYILAISGYTFICLIIFGAGGVITCASTVVASGRKRQSLQRTVLKWMENVVLDDLLQQWIQAGNNIFWAMTSTVGLYLLPLSQECRGELIDSAVPSWCQIHGLECNSQACQDSHRPMSQIMLQKGGLISLSPNYFRQRVQSLTETSEGSCFIVLRQEQLELEGTDMAWTDINGVPAFVENTTTETDSIHSAILHLADTTDYSPPHQPTLAVALFHAGVECSSTWFLPLYLGIKKALRNRSGTLVLISVLVGLRQRHGAKHIYSVLRSIIHSTAKTSDGSFSSRLAAFVGGVAVATYLGYRRHALILSHHPVPKKSLLNSDRETNTEMNAPLSGLFYLMDSQTHSQKLISLFAYIKLAAKKKSIKVILFLFAIALAHRRRGGLLLRQIYTSHLK
jgi:hypothetical protein